MKQGMKRWNNMNITIISDLKKGSKPNILQLILDKFLILSELIQKQKREKNKEKLKKKEKNKKREELSKR